MNRTQRAYSVIPVENSILGSISLPSRPMALDISNTERMQAIAIKRDASAKNLPGHILKQVNADVKDSAANLRPNPNADGKKGSGVYPDFVTNRSGLNVSGSL